MALSTAAKIAMCACPPALMAGSVATVPAVKRAVHGATAPRHPHHPHAAHRRAPAGVARRPDCAPPGVSGMPAAPIVTYAAPIPAEPGSPDIGGGSGGGAPLAGVGAPAAAGIPIVAGAGGTPEAVPATPAGPGAGPGGGGGAVPEPATWLMLIVGAGGVGVALRRRRRGAVGSGGALLRAGAAEAGGMAASSVTGSTFTAVGNTAAGVAGKSTLAAAAGKSTLSAVAGKAMLCVCPAVAVVGGVMAVPPLRAAVHAATMPAAPLAVAAAPAPCPPDGTVPVDAAAVNGFPATVTTAAAHS